MRLHDLHELQLQPLITRALEEDWGYGDWATDICVPESLKAEASLVSRDEIVVSGVDVARAVLHKVDPSLKVTIFACNGTTAQAGDVLLTVEGNSRSILKSERVILNYLGHMCGVATLTRAFVEQLSGTKCQLLDARKTTPGIRLLEKTATVTGGARNHRIGLCDGVIVKENHIKAAGSIKNAISKLLESLPPTLKIEVEVTNLDEVQEAVDAGADIVVLENMSIPEMALAVKAIRGRAKVEASGSAVKLETVRKIAETGVDFISTGAIVQGSKWADVYLMFN